MASVVLRFRKDDATPGVVPARVCEPGAVLAVDCPVTCDITVDDTVADAVAVTTAAMALEGWALVETNPTSPLPSGGGSGMPSGYLNGMQLSWVSATTVEVAVGSCRDSADSADITASATLQADITAGGAGGLDTGLEAVSSWYAVHVIDGTAGVAALLSLSATAPSLPAGYTTFRRVGWVFNDAGGDFRYFVQRGSGRDRKVLYPTSSDATAEIFTGSASAGNTWQQLSLADYVPPTSRYAKVSAWFSGVSEVRYQPHGAGIPAAGTAANFVAAKAFVWIATDDSQQIDWSTNNATGTVWIYGLGYEDSL